MSADELKGMPDESDLDGPLVDYKTKGSQVELAGKEDASGKTVYRLKITGKSGEVRSYLIDGSTFLTTKWEGIRKVGDQDLPWECTLSDYHQPELSGWHSIGLQREFLRTKRPFHQPRGQHQALNPEAGRRGRARNGER